MIYKDDWFIDIEVEGKFIGLLTLFIVNFYDVQKIERILKCYDIKQIYFGAGYQTKIKDYDCVRYFMKSDYIISLEVCDISTVPNDILSDIKCHKIITYKEENDFNYQNNITVKIENKHGITCFIKSIYNLWSDYNEGELK